jgi:hypothetical protein
LENYFVHRSRTLEKKDGNPLNEVRVLCTSMMSNDGKLAADKQIRLDPAKSRRVAFGPPEAQSGGNRLLWR